MNSVFEMFNDGLQITSNSRYVRFVDPKMGPGWWHIMKFKAEETDPTKKFETHCGFPVIAWIKPPEIINEPDSDDWVCDTCLDIVKKLIEEQKDGAQAS